MRYIEIDEQQKNVPVFKNVIYALKITWKADKRLLLGYILQEGFFAIFSKKFVLLAASFKNYT